MIRKVEPRDKALLLRLTEEFYASEAVLHAIPKVHHERLFEELMRSDAYAEAYIIEQDTVPAGYALLAKTYSHESGGPVIWIEEIYILPAFRGNGLGREFFEYLENNYGASVCRFRLEYEPDNKKAAQLYRRLGFQELEYRQMVKENSRFLIP